MLEQVVACVSRRPAQPPPVNVQMSASPVAMSPSVERRQMNQLDTACTIRSPAVLGFAGLVGGLLLSAILIVLVALVVAICETRWSNASQYCAIMVFIVFGTAGAVLYWDAADAKTRILALIEPVIERRNDYLHLSSLDAFENLRTLTTWAHAAMPTHDEVAGGHPRRAPVRSVRPDPVPASLPHNPRVFADSRAEDETDIGKQETAARYSPPRAVLLPG